MSRKDQPETHEQLLERYRQIEADKRSRGEAFDIQHELCAAIARRDHKVALKKESRHVIFRQLIHFLVQLVLLFFIYAYWDDLKIVLVLLLVMLWRSMRYTAGQIKYSQLKTLDWLMMAHPKAKDDFFWSEHCYGPPIKDRVFELLRRKPA